MQKLPYGKFGRDYIQRNVYVIAFLLLCFITVVYFQGKNAILSRIGLVLLVGGAIAGTIWDRMRLKRFVCPKCGTEIQKQTPLRRKDGDPINYYCPTCDIEWETGLSETSTGCGLAGAVSAFAHGPEGHRGGKGDCEHEHNHQAI